MTCIEIKRSACVAPEVDSLADPGFGQGGPDNFGQRFANVMQRSGASKASPNWLGSRACLRALEALAFLFFKYAFSWFSGHLLLKFKRLISPQ